MRDKYLVGQAHRMEMIDRLRQDTYREYFVVWNGFAMVGSP